MRAAMNENELPVSVQVRRPDGSVETVRVGTAVRSGEGFLLKLDLVIGGEGASTAYAAAAPRAGAAPRASASASASSGPMPTIFPPYGRSKGLPIAGASRGDLEFYANGCKRTLNDPSKARFHDKERTLLAVIEAELARQGGGEAGDVDSGGGFEPPPHGDHDMPPDEG